MVSISGASPSVPTFMYAFILCMQLFSFQFHIKSVLQPMKEMLPLLKVTIQAANFHCITVYHTPQITIIVIHYHVHSLIKVK